MWRRRPPGTGSIGCCCISRTLGLIQTHHVLRRKRSTDFWKTSRSDSTQTGTIFEGFNWHVQNIDGHDHSAIREAIEKAQVIEQPSIIIGKTIMARGTANMEGDHRTHGAPLPQEEIKATKEKLNLPVESFYVPGECITHFQSGFEELRTNMAEWQTSLNYVQKRESFKSKWELIIEDKLPYLTYPEFEAGTSVATRKAFGTTLDTFAKHFRI